MANFENKGTFLLDDETKLVYYDKSLLKKITFSTKTETTTTGIAYKTTKKAALISSNKKGHSEQPLLFKNRPYKNETAFFLKEYPIITSTTNSKKSKKEKTNITTFCSNFREIPVLQKSESKTTSLPTRSGFIKNEKTQKYSTRPPPTTPRLNNRTNYTQIFQ